MKYAPILLLLGMIFALLSACITLMEWSSLAQTLASAGHSLTLYAQAVDFAAPALLTVIGVGFMAWGYLRAQSEAKKTAQAKA